MRITRDTYSVNTLMIEPPNGDKAWAPHGEELIPPGGIVHIVGPFDELSPAEA